MVPELAAPDDPSPMALCAIAAPTATPTPATPPPATAIEAAEIVAVILDVSLALTVIAPAAVIVVFAI